MQRKWQRMKEIVEKKLDNSFDDERKMSPFLTGTNAIKKAIESGQVFSLDEIAKMSDRFKKVLIK